MIPNIAFPLTVSKRSPTAPYAIEDAHGDPVVYAPPTRPNREQEVRYLALAGNAHGALLAAAKAAVMESASLISDTILSETVATALNAAIERAGGWSDAEQETLDALALGEDVPDTDGGE